MRAHGIHGVMLALRSTIADCNDGDIHGDVSGCHGIAMASAGLWLDGTTNFCLMGH